jgi:hypothetical protein
MFQKLIHWIIGKPQPTHQLGNSQSCIFCGAYSTNRSDFDIVWEVRIHMLLGQYCYREPSLDSRASRIKNLLPFGTFVHRHNNTFNSSQRPTLVSFTKLSTSLTRSDSCHVQEVSGNFLRRMWKCVSVSVPAASAKYLIWIQVRRMEEIGHSILDTFNVPVSKRK